MSDIDVRALGVAYEWHKDQKRKYTGEPYIIHPVRVGLILKAALADAGTDGAYHAPEHYAPEVTIAVGFLHDVIEDCDVNIDDFIYEFGGETGEFLHDLVMQVTQVSRPEDGNRAKRKRMDLEHYAQSNEVGATVKLADLVDNCRDIIEHDLSFGEVFVREMEDLLPVLAHGHPFLRNLAEAELEKAKARLAGWR